MASQSFSGFPVPALFAIFAGVIWYKYFDVTLSKKKYLAGIGIFTVLSVLTVLSTGLSVASAMLAGLITLICAGTAHLGLVGSTNLSRWTSILSSRSRIRKKLSSREIKTTFIWGQAGQLDDAIDKFGEQAVALGAAGENFTAELMENLLAIPGTRIFHGLEFPGSANADVDHAIINGDKIVFVDSKLWKAGDYSWSWDGVINQKSGGVNTKINTNFHHAVLGYSKNLPEAQIRSRILIHSASGRAVNIDNRGAGNHANGKEPVTEMITAQQFFEETGDWFSESTPGRINKPLVSALYSKLK